MADAGQTADFTEREGESEREGGGGQTEKQRERERQTGRKERAYSPRRSAQETERAGSWLARTSAEYAGSSTGGARVSIWPGPV